MAGLRLKLSDFGFRSTVKSKKPSNMNWQGAKNYEMAKKAGKILDRVSVADFEKQKKFVSNVNKLLTKNYENMTHILDDDIEKLAEKMINNPEKTFKDLTDGLDINEQQLKISFTRYLNLIRKRNPKKTIAALFVVFTLVGLDGLIIEMTSPGNKVLGKLERRLEGMLKEVAEKGAGAGKTIFDGLLKGLGIDTTTCMLICALIVYVIIGGFVMSVMS